MLLADLFPCHRSSKRTLVSSEKYKIHILQFFLKTKQGLISNRLTIHDECENDSERRKKTLKINLDRTNDVIK